VPLHVGKPLRLSSLVLSRSDSVAHCDHTRSAPSSSDGRLGSDGGLGGTTDLTSSSGSNETRLLTGGALSGHSGGVTNMLLVTTTVGMVDGVHGDTTDTGPSVSLGLVLPE